MNEVAPEDRSWIEATVERLRQQTVSNSRPPLEDTPHQHLEKVKLQGIGLSPRHLRLLLAPVGLQETTALRAAQSFCQDPSLWCLSLLGVHGAGKTFAAEWALLESVRSGVTTMDGKNRFVGPYELRDAAYDSMARERLKKTGALVLDDLGCEGRVRAEMLHWVLFEILDHRWRHEKKTIITSNFSARQFKQRYGRRITDRLTDGGRCVAIGGANLRAQNASVCGATEVPL